MKKLMTLLLLIATVHFTNAQSNQELRSQGIRLLVVTGGPGLVHQISLVPTSFYTIFEGYDNLTWDHASYDEAAFQSKNLMDYDVLLMYNRSDSISETSKQNLQKYLESGKGLVVLHHALGSYNNWEWWWKNVVGGKYQMVEDSHFQKSGYKQGESVDMTVEANHAITKAIGSFNFIDETYKDLWISKEVEVLYRTNNPTSDGPTMWIGPYDRSKVVVIQPGHARPAHLDQNYRKLIYESILWVADEGK